MEAAQTAILAVKKANPRILITVWKQHIADKYRDDIQNGNINFFLDKVYSNDIQEVEESGAFVKKFSFLGNAIK